MLIPSSVPNRTDGKAGALPRALLSMLATALMTACNDDAVIGDYNDLPRAEAQLIHPVTGAIVDTAPDGSLGAVTFPYGGTPVRVTLTAQNSRDPDGTIEEYRWLSATRMPDGGVPTPPLRQVPAGQQRDWPTDGETTTVEVGAGAWAFSLWVRDDHGAWSRPDTVRFLVAASVAPSSATAALGPLSGLDAGLAEAR